MPIRFRCRHCGQLLSITRRRAGEEVTCPQCVHRTKVPKSDRPAVVDEDDDAGERLQLVRQEPASVAAASAAGDEDPWKEQSAPWAHEDEDEDFQISRAGIEDSGLDMTPMVDVTFLLLIFFMITASFSMQKSLETTPPNPDDESAAQAPVIEEFEEESVVVEIDEEDNLRVDDVAVSGIFELIDVLAGKIANEGKTEMLIEAHAAATHGRVVAVTDAGIEVQMQRIRRASKRNAE